MITKLRNILFALTAFVLACCTSDPEGPVSEIFLEDGTYGPRGNVPDTIFTAAVSGTTISIPDGIGNSLLLVIGESAGIEYRAILMKFKPVPSEEHSGKQVSSAVLHLPIRVAPDSAFSLDATFNELEEDFSEEDTIISVPPHDSEAIPDTLGETVRVLSINVVDYSLDGSLVQEWLDGTREHHGVAVLLEEGAASGGLIEMNARELGSDPPAIRVEFEDGSDTVYAAVTDYSVASFEGEGLHCIGGVATRIFFEFDLEELLHEKAIINYARLVLSVEKEGGLGATPGEESLLGLSRDFIFYMYTPNVSDPGDTLWRSGTGVGLGSFNPRGSETLTIGMTGFIEDILLGLRENTGLVLQSDLERVRIQKASFYTGETESSLRPRIEVVYSRPAEFARRP